MNSPTTTESVVLTEAQTAEYKKKTPSGTAYRRCVRDAAIATSRWLGGQAVEIISSDGIVLESVRDIDGSR